ncbi:MAG: EscU/YscU/HrcU family type III secretion system export apparatus switch protein [Vitreimonas sp.]
MAENEQNKTEEATPFKLKRGREKGSVARSIDLGFFSTTVAFLMFALVAGPRVAIALAETMRSLLHRVSDGSPEGVASVAPIAAAMLQPLALLAATIVVVVIFFEIVQLRGVVFSAQPLKPDFSRLNPAQGLKRLFSMRMVKETVKNVLKLAAYGVATYVVISDQFLAYRRAITGAGDLTSVLAGAGFRLISAFALLALAFAALDQVLVRGEFRKQMRMSRREVQREHREREGEPRLKQKRRQLHAQFAKQARAFGNLPGSDMVVVNPEHFAVALRYEASTMSAPTVTAKGRNYFALYLRGEAAKLSIAIFEHPTLARSLFRNSDLNQEISSSDYRAVADLYLKLAKKASAHAKA